jgi:hypothetical protein
MIEIASFECPSCGHYHVTVGGATIAIGVDRGMIERIARLLAQARDARHREAMRILVQDLGFTEAGAMNTYMVLRGIEQEATIQ